MAESVKRRCHLWRKRKDVTVKEQILVSVINTISHQIG